MVCPHCGTSNSEGSIFCMRCGHDLLEMVFTLECPNCGTTNSDGAKYCMGCGHSLATKVFPPAGQPPAPAQPANIAAQAPGKPLPGSQRNGFDPLDLLFALVGTGVGVLAGFISKPLLSQVSYPLPPLAITLGGNLLTILIACLGLILLAVGVLRSSAVKRKTKFKQLIRKESGFFMQVDEDTAILLSKAEKTYAD